MKVFRLKPSISDAERQSRGLAQEVHIVTIVDMQCRYNSNPLNEVSTPTVIKSSDSVWYFDKGGNPYPQKYMDMFYEECGECDNAK